MGEGKFGGEMLRLTYPDWGSRQAVRSARRDSGLAGAPASSNSVASATPSPVAIFSSTTAVGLLSPRSTSESMERLTAHFAASASRLRPSAVRSARTRPAMRALMSGAAGAAAALSGILDISSSRVEQMSTRARRTGRGELALQVAETGLALDVLGGAGRVEGCGRSVAGLAGGADLAEIGLEAGRRHRPGHLEVAGAGVDDLVLEPGRRHDGGAGHERMTLAVDLDLAGALEAEQDLHLAVVAVLLHEATRRNHL